MMKITALIMAGGKGERFWPQSRQKLPKQFLCLTESGRTMIQSTVDRISDLVDIEDIYVATNQAYKDLVKEQLPDLPEQNILCEPMGKNTAPCIGLGAVHMRRKYGDAVMMVLPSDHLIGQPQIYCDILQEGVRVAEEADAIVTLGISPTHPDTGYGYIQYDMDASRGYGEAHHVIRFVEKPNLEVAKQYVDSGDYLWNSGMFIWRVSTILEQMKRHLPENYALLEAIEAAITTPEQDEVLLKKFQEMQSISIDYGVMEHAEDIYVIPSSFGWDDVGSWLAIGRVNPADAQDNVLLGDVITVNTQRCIVKGGNKFIAIVGLQDIIVVDTEDSLLLCSKEHAGSIKSVLEELRRTNRTDLL